VGFPISRNPKQMPETIAHRKPRVTPGSAKQPGEG
jgi:hypothetical protein